MFKSNHGKPGKKFSCMPKFGCLPVKGCLQKNSSDKRAMAAAMGAYDDDERDKDMGAHFRSEHDEARMEHTKQWLQNLSTVVNYDPSMMAELGDLSGLSCKKDDPDDTVMQSPESSTLQESDLLAAKTCKGECCRQKASKDDIRSQKSDVSSGSCAKKQFDDTIASENIGPFDNSTFMRDHKESFGQSSFVSSRAENNGICNNSLASDNKGLYQNAEGACGGNNYDDSFLSSAVCDSSALSSKCCSQHKRRRRRHGAILSSTTLQSDRSLNAAETCSIISGSSSTVSLATEMVTLNLDDGRHLGITIVGHSNANGDCGIFVGGVKKGGAAELNGRIEPGDLILEVNGVDLERMTNDQALQVLRSQLERGGLVRILIAKYWDMDGEEREDTGRRGEPLYEPIGSVHSMVSHHPSQPAVGKMYAASGSIVDSVPPTGRNPLRSIPELQDNRSRMYYEASGISAKDVDRGLSHFPQRPYTMAIQPSHHHYHQPPPPPPTSYHPLPPLMSSLSSLPTCYPDSGFHEHRAASRCCGTADLPTCVGSRQSMLQPPQPASSTIDRRMQAAARGARTDASPQPFLGSDLVEWIRGQVKGLADRRDALVYAENLLKAGYIYNVHQSRPGSGTSFNFYEHEYYVFGKAAEREFPNAYL